MLSVETQRSVFTLTGAIALGFAAGAAVVAYLAMPTGHVPEWVAPVRKATFAAVGLVMLAGLGSGYANWRAHRERAILDRENLTALRRGLRISPSDELVVYAFIAAAGLVGVGMALVFTGQPTTNYGTQFQKTYLTKIAFGMAGVALLAVSAHGLVSTGEQA